MTDLHRHTRRHLAFAATALLLAALLIGGYFTRGGDASLAYNGPPPLPNTTGLVDQKPLETARGLSAEAATPPEVEFARQAMQIADHEVDQAFAQALRQATESAPRLTGPALLTSRRINELTERVQAEEEQLKAAASGRQDPALAEAQLALDQDELEDLQQDLLQLGGDRKGKIQQALDQHEAVQKLSSTRPPNADAEAMESPESLRTFPGKLRAYLALGKRANQLEDARADAVNAAHELGHQHDALESRAETEKASSTGATGAATADRLNTLNALHTQAAERTSLAQLDKQIHDEQQLVEIYTKWKALVLSQRTTVLHRIFRMLLAVVVLLAAMLTADTLIRRFFERPTHGRRMRTMQMVLTIAVQLVGFGLILLVLFGTPRQTPTIIGLATAGLTVALKDFIVAFFGWFVLIGKNGVRVGDWVEINSVSGEVIELGIMRTVLLETGSWSESAQPTGRRVTFMNGYAIEGQFFNFSTAGQWLWDELHITVPSGAEAYAKVDAIRRAVEERTKQDIALAERDWQRATHAYSARSFRAAPTVDLRPMPDGIQVNVRYITRAQERAQVRSELYEKAIGILHFPDHAFAHESQYERERMEEPVGA